MNPHGYLAQEPSDSPRPVLLEWALDGVFEKLEPDEVRVWVVELDGGKNPEDDEDAPAHALAPLSADEQARAARFVRPRDRRRFARCRVALREILGRLMNVPAAAVRIRASGEGKPELDPETASASTAGARSCLRFNVSHSGGVGLIGVCNGREIGIDIEEVRLIQESDRIVESFFSPRELAAFAALAAEEKPEAFLRGWTRKEAILKGLGIGLAGLAAHYETWFGTSQLMSCFTRAGPVSQIDHWHLWEAAPRPGYVAALAICARATPEVRSRADGGG